MNDRKKRYWRICVVLVLIILVLGFSPVMLPKGVYKPMIFGIPYSLWLSFLLTAVLVLLTYIGARLRPDDENGKEEL